LLVVTRPSSRLLPLLVPLAALLAYGSAPGNGFVWDDHAVIEKGGLIGSLANVPALFAHDAMWNSDGGDFAGRATIDTYRPVTLTTFAFERAAFGLRPGPYHLVSVLLHAFNALLLFILGVRLGLGRGPALAGALLFAVHPSISEAVHWINGRSDPLAVGCFLGAVLLWLALLDRLAAGRRAGVWGRAAGVALLALLGTLSKETFFLMVGALPLLLLDRRCRPRQWVVALSPWLLGLGVGFAMRLAALGRPAVAGGGYHVIHALPRVPLVWSESLLSLLSPAPRLVPSLHQHFARVTTGRLIFALVVVLLAVAAAAWAWRQQPRTATSPAAAAAAASPAPWGGVLLPWAVLTWLLALAPIALLTQSEGWSGWGRYLYPAAPLTCLFLGVAVVGEVMPRARAAQRRLLHGALAALGALALLACAAQTFVAGFTWRDDESLARGWIEEAPDSGAGYLALGIVHYDRRQLEAARALFQEAVARAPRNAEMNAKLALAHSALGQAPQAWQLARRAQALEPSNRLARYLVALGLLGRRREAEAAQLLVPLLAEQPNEDGLWKTMGEAWTRTGPGSAFRLTVAALVREPRYQVVGRLLPIRLGDH
jgi:protein O-mannosyl-transferase